MSIIGDLETVLFRQGRSIAGIIPNVTVEESHHDEMTITNHPVEQGATISDHAFKNPAQVTCRYGWSNSSLLQAAAVDLVSGLLQGSLGGASGDSLDVNQVYAKLLELQTSAKPFDLVTGKRSYSNMLIKSLSMTTDAATENALIVTAVMQQVIIVQTQVTTLQPAENHAQPQSTAPMQNTGTKQPQAVSQTLEYRSANAVTNFFGFSLP